MREETKQLQKLIVIVGPTASGKTNWALRLAQKFNGDIISADSRQIYKKMDIGTAKEPGEWRRNGLRKTYYIEDVPHHLVDFLDPGKAFTVAEFRDKAVKYVKMAHEVDKMPLLVGGTGLYVHSLVENLQIPRIPPNKKLRDSLEEKNNEELMTWLTSLDPKTAETVDPNNKRRLIRALEVCILSGIPFSEQQIKGDPLFDILEIGIEVERETLYERIDNRVQKMFDLGLIKEVEILLKQKYSWELPSMSGIGYRQFKEYFEKKISLDEVKENLKHDTRRYAKRQMTWFRRDEKIKWCKEYEEAEKLVEEFLRK
ncbi:MAG: tRNA (adenosine(37)-N6)-dimethylallyltransferase MiaA [Candidatus Magasanikiibacteriota bacterium]